MISSNGIAAREYTYILGQYEYDVYKKAFVQKNTEHNINGYWPRYIYSNKKDQWFVGLNNGGLEGWLFNQNKSKKIPQEGWKVLINRKYQKDPTLKVIQGSLSLSKQYEVTASGGAADMCPSCLGIFNKTERWWNGRPIYENTNGYSLYHDSYGWSISKKIGERTQYGTYGTLEHSNEWNYWNGSEYKVASVTVSSVSERVRRQSKLPNSNPGMEIIHFSRNVLKEASTTL